MEILILNDGTQVNGHILPNGDDRIIFVYLDGMSLVDGFTLFTDPEKAKRITANFYGQETVYEGFTELTSISSEYGNCNITMKRGEVDVAN